MDVNLSSGLPLRAEHLSVVEVRWVCPGRITGSRRRQPMPATELPMPMASLRRIGVITEVWLSSAGLDITFVDAEAARTYASQVDETLYAALLQGHMLTAPQWAQTQQGARVDHATDPGTTQNSSHGSASSDDRELADLVAVLLDGELGSYIASHGGQIQLVSVQAGVVKLRLAGACRGCPASFATVSQGISPRLASAGLNFRGVEVVR